MAGLAVFGVAARDAHPATHQPVQAAESDDSTTFSFGGSSLGDSGSVAPQIQSSGS